MSTSTKHSVRGAGGRFVPKSSDGITQIKESTKTVSTTEKNTTLTLADGTTLTGKTSVVLKNAKALGHEVKETEFYNSASRGLVPIKEMNTQHLQNVVAKKFPDHVRAVAKTAKTGQQFVEGLIDFSTMLNTDTQLLAMIRELGSRTA